MPPNLYIWPFVPFMILSYVHGAARVQLSHIAGALEMNQSKAASKKARDPTTLQNYFRQYRGVLGECGLLMAHIRNRLCFVPDEMATPAEAREAGEGVDPNVKVVIGQRLTVILHQARSLLPHTMLQALRTYCETFIDCIATGGMPDPHKHPRARAFDIVRELQAIRVTCDHLLPRELAAPGGI